MINEILIPILKNSFKSDVAPKDEFGQVPVSKKCRKADREAAPRENEKNTERDQQNSSN